MNRSLGAQYYTIRECVSDIESFDVACKKVSDIGYKIVQISNMPLQAKEMREILDKYGLKVVVSHRKFADFMSNLDEVIDYNKTLGCDICGVGMTPYEYVESNDTVTNYIREVNKICDVLKSEKMFFGCHNHTMEFAKFEGKVVMDRFIEEINPEVFSLIADTYWLQLGGHTPHEWIRKMGKRAKIVHFKDLKINPQEYKVPLITEVGNGNLYWDEIIKACDDAGVEWAIVEQDRNHIDDDPFKALKVSYDFLKSKGFH